MSTALGAYTFLAALRQHQNSDGGWGCHKETRSRVEPTCWAISALGAERNSSDDSVALTKARRYLMAEQENKGFWTATPEMKSGSWVTSLACAVLANTEDADSAVVAGMAWLCNDYPLDSNPALRFIHRILSKDVSSKHNDSFRGWGWTPRTSSWVEPTAFALLALQESRAERLPSAASQRRELAVGLLYDRMCPGGGWNCGNPRVYGVAGEALILPTAWALIALQAFPEHQKKSLSLAWLEAEMPQIESPGSLAVASMCLEAYGRRLPATRLNLRDCSPEGLLEDGIHVLAWVSLALNPNRAWPAGVRGVR
jgi:hypothetical protein